MFYYWSDLYNPSYTFKKKFKKKPWKISPGDSGNNFGEFHMQMSYITASNL